MHLNQLNYHHLYYFWNVAKEGSIVKASQKLFLSEPTISVQIKNLEAQLGESLFEKDGKGLKKTEMGEVVFQFAEDIFSLGENLVQVIQGQSVAQVNQLSVGIVDVIPKILTVHLFKPLITENTKLICMEGGADQLLQDMSLHKLDLIISDRPIHKNTNVSVDYFSLLQSDITLFAKDNLVKNLKKGFPKKLDGAPFLLPTEDSFLRRSLEDWFLSNKISPNVVGEFQDSALMKVFGQEGVGVFAAHSIIEKQIIQKYNVKKIGRISQIKEKFYAIVPKRKIMHPFIEKLVSLKKES